MRSHRMPRCLLPYGFMVAALFACQPSLADPPVGIPEAVPTVDDSHPRAKLVVGSEVLLGKIGVGKPQFRVLGKLSQAQVMVQNLTETRYTLEYKFDWENGQGFNVDSINAWHRFTLTPRETKTFNSTGKSPDATNIVFTVRLPDDVFIEDYKQRPTQEETQ